MKIQKQNIIRRGWAIGFLMGLFSWGITQSNAQPHRLSIPLYSLVGNRTYDGGWQVGAGLRYGQHEIVGFLGTPFIDDGPYGGGHYRYYLRGSGRPVQPYLGIEGGLGVLPGFISVSGQPYDLQTRGIYGVSGIEFPLWGSLWGFGQVGVGWTDLQALEGNNNLDDVATVGYYSVGLKYDLLLRGNRSEEKYLPSDHPEHPRFFLAYRARWSPNSSNISHQILAEWKWRSWLRFYGGLQGGQIERFTIQGLGLGMKIYSYQRGPWACIQEVGYYFLERSKFNYSDSHVLVGNHFEYRISPQWACFVGQVLSINGNGTRPGFIGGVQFEVVQGRNR